MKFALIGSSCSGKTTACHAVTAELRRIGVDAVALASSDRRSPFLSSLLDTEESAQRAILLAHAAEEARLEVCHPGAVIVSDRSTVDYLAYYEVFFPAPKSTVRLAVEDFAMRWAASYDALFYFSPLEYVPDGKRPPPERVAEVDDVVRRLARAAGAIEAPAAPDMRGIFVVERIKKRVTAARIDDEQRERIARWCRARFGARARVFIGGSQSRLGKKLPTLASDVDVYVFVNHAVAPCARYDEASEMASLSLGLPIEMFLCDMRYLESVSQGMEEATCSS